MAVIIKPCCVEGCNQAAGDARGMCIKHYRRWQRHGDPTVALKNHDNIGKPCKVDGCNRISASRGWCGVHYRRWRLHGDPMAVKIALRGDKRQWILDNVGYSGDDCLVWPFKLKTNGRTTVTIDGVAVVAAREMCRLAHGEPPTPKHEAAHSCGKGDQGCLNPRHLRWATHVENEADKVSHGTSPRGRSNGCAVLTENDVRLIRASSETGAALARRLGVSASAVSLVRLRRAWAWLD